MQNLQGAGAVVTGAGHGIGKALASRLVAEGARVVVNDLDAEACAAVAAELGATSAPGDCSSDEGVRALVGTASEAARAGSTCSWPTPASTAPSPTASRPPTRTGRG